MGERLPLDVRSVANYVLHERLRFGYSTSHLELQKLVYFAHGLLLSQSGEPLVDGYFEAWEHGPVHPHIYQNFKKFGKGDITELCESTDLISGETGEIPMPSDPKLTRLISSVVLQLYPESLKSRRIG
jgi:uncharacterized phage-associated protein